MLLETLVSGQWVSVRRTTLTSENCILSAGSRCGGLYQKPSAHTSLASRANHAITPTIPNRHRKLFARLFAVGLISHYQSTLKDKPPYHMSEIAAKKIVKHLLESNDD